MSLITALGDKSADMVTDLHRYFVKLTGTDVQYKPFTINLVNQNLLN